MSRLEKEVKISYYATDSNLVLSCSNLLLALQELAIGHSDTLGYTLDYLFGINKCWIILNWHIQIERMPKCGEIVKIKTWSSDCKKIKAERSFEIKDESDNTIIVATTKWAYLDTLTKRPSVVPEKMIEDYYCPLPSIIENEKFKLKGAEEENYKFEFSDYIRRSETDSNGHTNNTKYVAWAMDLIPDNIYNTMQIFDIAVSYKKESYKGSKVSAKTYIEEVGETIEVITMFLDSENGNVFCQVNSNWQ